MKINLLTLLLVTFFSLSAFTQAPKIILPTITVDESEEFIIDITAENFDSLIAMQFTIKWDSSKAQVLEAFNFNLPDLDESNFGLAPVNTDLGLLPMFWEDQTLLGVSREDGTVLFSLRMKATGEVGDVVSFQFVGAPAAIEIVNVAQNAIPDIVMVNSEITYEDLVGVDAAIESTIEVNNFPNPFNEYTFINFDIKETTDLTLIITDISGRQIYTAEKSLNSGFHQMKIDASVFPSPGEYFYYVRTNEYQLFKKLIFVK